VGGFPDFAKGNQPTQQVCPPGAITTNVPQVGDESGLPEHMLGWGRQQGSVYLGDHQVAVTVPRVRNLRRGQEVPLASYQALGRPRRAEDAALVKLLKGLSCRDYEACVEPAAETFG